MRFTLLTIAWLALCGAPGVGAAPQVALEPPQPAPGEVFRVTVDGVPAGEGVQAAFGEREFALWQVSDRSWEGLAAVDRDQPPGAADLQLSVLRRGSRQPLVTLPVTVAAREYPEQHLRVREGMVNLSPGDQARAADENRRIRKVLGRRSAVRLWQTPFAMPLSGPVTSAFGVRRVYNGTPKSYHSGLDIAAPRGTVVRSAGAGTVALVGDFFYTGNTVIVDHGLGLYTAYFHLDAVAVGEEQEVPAAGELGQVGSTGRSTGPHLHWGVYLSGRKADPLSLLHLFGAAGGGETP
jgi:murein DD-endopeptidase MepM/ murein hydrolase activator NlpD